MSTNTLWVKSVRNFEFSPACCDEATQPGWPPPLDLERCVVFDVEVYPGSWCVGFLGLTNDGEWVHDCAETTSQLEAILSQLHQDGKTLLGYNSQRYDVPMVRAILAGEDAHETSKRLIESGDRTVLEHVPTPNIDHIDLAERFRRGGKFPGLKTLAARLGLPTIQELPYPPDATLDDDAWQEVKTYNRVDLEVTWTILERVAPELAALTQLSREFDIDLRSVSTPQVVERLFKAAYQKQKGCYPRPSPVPDSVRYHPPSGVVRPQTPAAAEWFDRLTSEAIPVVDRGGRPKADIPSLSSSQKTRS
jgi:hypothetical protein